LHQNGIVGGCGFTADPGGAYRLHLVFDEGERREAKVHGPVGIRKESSSDGCRNGKVMDRAPPIFGTSLCVCLKII